MNIQLIAERGERDISADVGGNVYIPAGHIYVYLYKIRRTLSMRGDNHRFICRITYFSFQWKEQL